MNSWILGVCLMFMNAAFLQEKAKNPEESKRIEFLNAQVRGKQFTVEKETYQHLSQVFAVRQIGTGKQLQETLSIVGASLDSFVETKGQFLVYRGSQINPVASLALAGNSVVYPMVLNTRTGATGVLLGTLVVTPKRMADVAAIASDHGLEVEREFSHLKVVFYRVKNNADVIDAATALSGDARVEKAYPEILENPVVPN